MIRYLRAANVKDGRLDLDDVKSMDFTPSEQAVFALRPGDVLVTEGAGSLAAVGASAVWNGELDGIVCFQNTLLRLRPTKGNDPRYLMWWARHAYGSGLFAAAAGGANIYHLGADTVRELAVAIPPPSNQRSIVAYLDAEVAQSDSIVAARRRQLALLDARGAALIWNAVTKGFDRNDLRDTSLEWAGAVPSHWEAPAIGAHFEVQLGKMLNPKAREGGALSRYLRNTNVQWDRFDLDSLDEMHFDAGDRARYHLRPGDLLVCEGGEVGRSAVWQGVIDDCYYQKALHRVRPLRDGDTRFLMYCLWAAASRGVFMNEGNTSTIVHLTAEKLRAHRVPWPPSDERARIVTVLDRERAADAPKRRAFERQIDLILERRQALITAAVTGELEIAGVAA